MIEDSPVLESKAGLFICSECSNYCTLIVA